MVAAVILLYGCHIADVELDKIAETKLSGRYSANLGSARYTVAELIEDIDDETIDVVTGEDMSINFVFTENSEFSNEGELIEIESVSNQAVFEPNINTPTVPLAFDLDFEEDYIFFFQSVDDKELDSIYYSAGTLRYLLESGFEADLDYTWEIVGLRERNSNDNLTGESSLVYEGSDVTDLFTTGLSGKKSTVSANSNGENEFIIKIKGTLHFEAGAQIRSTDALVFNLDFENPLFSEIFGFFGNEEVEVQKQTIDLDSFEDIESDGIELGQPSISIETWSTFGIDMGLDFSNLTAITADGSQLSLTESLLDSEKMISGSPILGEGVKSTITLDHNNSNIAELLNLLPSQLDFSLTALSNPPSATLATNFVSLDSEITVDVTVSIPLNIKFDGFSTDFDFELEGLEDLDQVEFLEIEISVLNEIPFEGTINLEFLDDDDQVMHSMLDAAKIETPSVGLDGRVIEAVSSTSTIVFDEAGLEAFLDAKKIKGVVEINTFDSEAGTFIDIYADYALEMKLSVIVQPSISVGI